MMLSWYPADFVAGAIAMGYLVVAGFFISFWRRSGDGLFLAFAVAFTLLTIGAVIHRLVGDMADPVATYLVRLVAFLVIIAAIIRKNLGRHGD